MTYPIFQNKHLEEPLFTPKEYLGHYGSGEKFPKKAILTFQDSSLRYFKKRFKGEHKLKKFAGAKAYILPKKGILFLKIQGIGSPHAVTVLEELIAYGVKEFIIVGTAGGLQKEGIFLCNGALRDEGTSYHYHAHEKFSYPDKKLTGRLRKILEKMKIKHEKGLTWTIDAKKKKKKKEIEHYRKEGIATVEMEASALFAIAKLKNVKIAATFVVSDTLIKKWNPKFKHINTKKALNVLIDCAIECLRK